MKVTLFGCLAISLAATCLGQEAKPLCPRHIELPTYSVVAATAHIQGTVVLSVTIDADGSVTDAEATNGGKWALLEHSAITNIRRWTFTKPPFAPYKQTIVYDYQIDDSLPVDAPSKVTLDLPERVTIVTSARSVQTSRLTDKN